MPLPTYLTSTFPSPTYRTPQRSQRSQHPRRINQHTSTHQPIALADMLTTARLSSAGAPLSRQPQHADMPSCPSTFRVASAASRTLRYPPSVVL